MRKLAVLLIASLGVILGVVSPSVAVSSSNSVIQPQAVTLKKPVMPTWAQDATMYEVNLRQFSTGSKKFNGLKAQLPRLKSLGVKILWLMPIQPISQRGRLGSLGSPYAIKNYTQVNPEFGTLTEFKSLVTEAHKQGFHIILDWVGNHSGLDNVWTTTNPEWYDVVNGQIQPNQDWRDVADLNYDVPALRTAMFNAMKYWVTATGIDGFRCDFAGGVPTDFWEDTNAKLQAIKPLFMLSENQSDYSHLQSAFVSNYGWSMLGAFNDFASRGGDANSFSRPLDQTAMLYPRGTFPVNFITNHDENSWNGTEYERLGGYVKRFAALTFTFPGMPLMYNGQEIALNRRLAFFESDPIVWTKSTTTEFYRKLIALKTKNPALRNGAYGGTFTQLSGSTDDVLSFTRVRGTNKVVVVVNLTDSTQRSTVPLGSSAGTYYKYSNGVKVKLTSNYKFILPAGSFEIYSTNLVK
jgi:glycosidase